MIGQSVYLCDDLKRLVTDSTFELQFVEHPPGVAGPSLVELAGIFGIFRVSLGTTDGGRQSGWSPPKGLS